MRRVAGVARRPAAPTSTRTAGTRACRRRPTAPPAAIAYFSPEYGITAVLPQYSGGLGILAGDHLKAASDLGVPIVGVGLLYRAGYFAQSLSREGWQQERYPVARPATGCRITLLRDADGEPLKVERRRCPAAARCARRSGRRRSAGCRCCCSTPTSRTTTRPSASHRPALRRRQRAPAAAGDAARHRRRPGDARVLRAHRAPGARGVPHQRGPRRLPRPRADPRAHRGRRASTFDEALEAARAGTVFTTHTPVPAGIDRFPPRPGRAALRRRQRLPGRAGRPDPRARRRDYAGGDPTSSTWRVMGLRLAQRANGVAKLHGVGQPRRCSPGCGRASTPTRCRSRSVTNGVHAPTWVAPRGDRAGRARGRRRASTEAPRLGGIDTVADERASGRAPRAARRGWSTTPARRLRASWLQRGAERRRARLDRRRSSTPRCSPSASPAGCRRTSG